ncbi:MAG TPA: class I SAM-dependent methyltransferase [Solirubrobacteraceae bacterium]|nr:class I SAM-dependent methyltransferase [Solirubrobacteraceae bacterium]
MPSGSAGADLGELERLRRDYESSLSWRLTRPVRAAGRLGRRLRPPAVPDDASAPSAQNGFDGWLAEFFGERLAAIDAACGPEIDPAHYALFRELDDDLWALLLTQQYELYPNIRALLPVMPDPELQELWNGRSGLPLADQSASFYRTLRRCYERHGRRPLSEASVLDFGCGWGRLTRYLARDVAPGRLYGCDPVQGILDVARASRVPATLATSDFLPETLPFDEQFDLAFAFSVFTHLSEEAHRRSLRVLHRSLRPGGILVVTVRPPAYLRHSELMRSFLEAVGPHPDSAPAAPGYFFAPHAAEPTHPQYEGQGEIHYGETVITMAYVREHWSPLFTVLDVQLLLNDPYQVVLVLGAAG